MIVIVVLGIIATLTIPALVNKNKESVAKTKVRKAMAAYESALNKMIIENDLKSDTALNEWAGAVQNCGNPSNYFKKVQDVNGCIFKTSDGIWWNISDIERPVISFKEINAGNEEQITVNANNANDKTAFVLVGRFGTDGSLRVDDLAYETANSETVNNYKSYDQVAKLYNFLSGKKSSGEEEITVFIPISASDYEKIMSFKQKFLNGDYSTSCKDLYGEGANYSYCARTGNCKSCTVYGAGLWDENDFAIFNDYGEESGGCGYAYPIEDYCELVISDGNGNEVHIECTHEECTSSYLYAYGDYASYSDCDADLKNCANSIIPDKRDDMDIKWLCDGTGQNCAGIDSIKINNGIGSLDIRDCNLDGSICDLGMRWGCTGTCYDFADIKTDEATGQKYWSIKEQYRPTRNSNLTYSE